MTQFFHWVGDLFQASFQILPLLGNTMNVVIILLLTIAFFICLKKFI